MGYGSGGGTCAGEHLRLIASELQIATVGAQVALSLLSDLENYSVFMPGPHHQPTVEAMLDQVVSWSKALQPLRAGA